MGNATDNKLLKVQILMSRNFVVIAQAPRSKLWTDLSFPAEEFKERAWVISPVSHISIVLGKEGSPELGTSRKSESGSAMQAEIVADMIYLEEPEFPEYVMHFLT